MGRDANEFANRYIARSPTGPHVPPAEWRPGRTHADIRAEVADRLRGLPGTPHPVILPDGSTKYEPVSLAELARGYTDLAFAAQLLLLERAESEAVRLQAAQAVLDRGHGKVASGDASASVNITNIQQQSQSLPSDPAELARIARVLADPEMYARVLALAPPDEPAAP